MNNDKDIDLIHGKVRPMGELEIGPTQHEKFLDANYKKLVLLLFAVAAIGATYIIYTGVAQAKREQAGNALMHELQSPDAQKLSAFVSNHQGQASAETATFVAIQELWADGKEEEGTKKMKDFIAQTNSPDWKAQASVILAARYMNAGKLEEASQLFQDVIDMFSLVYSPYAIMCMGDISVAKGDTEKAQQYYNDMVKRYPTSSFVDNGREKGVTERISILNVKQPEMKSPADMPKKASNADFRIPEIDTDSSTLDNVDVNMASPSPQ